jgi:predicted P-loop ATPase
MVSKNYREYVESRGLSVEQALAAGIEDLDEEGTIEAVGDGSDRSSTAHKHLRQSSIGFVYRNPLDDSERKVRIRLSSPWKYEKDGKPKLQRYTERKGNAPMFFFPKALPPALREDVGLPLLITEGEMKSIVSTHHLIPTIGLGGVWNWKKGGAPIEDFGFIKWASYKDEDKRPLEAGESRPLVKRRVVYIAFDADLRENLNVFYARNALARYLVHSLEAEVRLVNIPKGEAKGIDDYIKEHGVAAARKLLDQALKWEEAPTGGLPALLKWVEASTEPYVRYNELSKRSECGGQVIDWDLFYPQLIQALNSPLKPKEDVIGIVEVTARKKSFHPVRDYLLGVHASAKVRNPQEAREFLEGLAARTLGAEGAMAEVKLQKTLIAAVARVINPGCKVDTATILVGKQGTGKSTFWRDLAGDEWFTDGVGDVTKDKDSILQLTRYWFAEWGELEQVTQKKEAAQVKEFLSRQVDEVRSPYHRSSNIYPRTFVMVGSSNRDDFLRDSTGNRRFWIIETGAIDLAYLKENRDRIWAAAVELYKAGESWYLDIAQGKVLEVENKDYLAVDPWTEPVLEILNKKLTATDPKVTTRELLDGLKLEDCRRTRGDEMRMADLLRQLGWERASYVGGRRYWVPRAINLTPNDHERLIIPETLAERGVGPFPVLEVDYEVETPSQRGIDPCHNQPNQPFTLRVEKKEDRGEEEGKKDSMGKGCRRLINGKASNPEDPTGRKSYPASTSFNLFYHEVDEAPTTPHAALVSNLSNLDGKESPLDTEEVSNSNPTPVEPEPLDEGIRYEDF